ncbi:hypothetical protein GCM10017667_37690 [Streptomyces filamentosus]|uniref:Uncharacterized protein n=1 Tax=Streptomyces filamentosus TaxID=67294 RepID=A0A919BPM1_STRFL|nr:hypothetical protein GCM10017667_37690 [Streptomyces filamentosus]
MTGRREATSATPKPYGSSRTQREGEPAKGAAPVCAGGVKAASSAPTTARDHPRTRAAARRDADGGDPGGGDADRGGTGGGDGRFWNALMTGKPRFAARRRRRTRGDGRG